MCYYVSVRIVIDTETNLDCVLLCVCAYSYRYGIPTWTVCYYVSVRIVTDMETNLDCVLLCVCAYSYRYGNQLGLCVIMCLCV